ncbi:hypothetical protein RUM44_007198 [Polyplax serrata]|uniref:Uncharacterized protein n=1 Tax=Polyplax serrata TaxID=468196 RepID=A0ABR1B021_POLSC
MTDITVPAVLLILILDICYSQNYYQNIDCDFEDDKCRWRWNTTIPNGFRVFSGVEAERYLRQNPDDDRMLFADADRNFNGEYMRREYS